MTNNIFRCLVIPGGGMKGRITVEFLYNLEKRIQEEYGCSLYQFFDMISATSTGGIIGGSMYLGIAIPRIRALYDLGKKVFVRSYLPWTPKYKRKPILDQIIHEAVNAGSNPNRTFGEINKHKYLMISSVNKCYRPARNVHFKSWKAKWSNLKIIEAIQYTFSAAYYFGASNSDRYRAVYGDGGEGNQNCPLSEAINSINRLGFRSGQVRVLKVGVGEYEETIPYRKAKRYGTIREAMPVVMMAQEQAPKSQVYRARAEEWDDKYKFCDVDINLPNKKLTALDGIKYIPEYASLGRKMTEKCLDMAMESMA